MHCKCDWCIQLLYARVYVFVCLLYTQWYTRYMYFRESSNLTVTCPNMHSFYVGHEYNSISGKHVTTGGPTISRTLRMYALIHIFTLLYVASQIFSSRTCNFIYLVIFLLNNIDFIVIYLLRIFVIFTIYFFITLFAINIECYWWNLLLNIFFPSLI